MGNLSAIGKRNR